MSCIVANDSRVQCRWTQREALDGVADIGSRWKLKNLYKTEIHQKEKLLAIFSIQGKTIYQRNQAVRLFLRKQGLLRFRMKWNVFPRVNMNREKYAMNFPDSKIIRIGAQLRHNAYRAKQKGSIKLLQKSETSYPFQLNSLIQLQDLIQNIIQKDVSERSLL